MPPSARWSYLQKRAKLPEIGKDIDAAMDAIERDNPSLKDVLPKVYARGNLDPVNLGKLIDEFSNVSMSNASTGSASINGSSGTAFPADFWLLQTKGHARVEELKCMRLRTYRLELIAATLDHIRAEIESPEHLAQLLGTTVEPGWPPGEYDCDAQKFFARRLEEEGEAVAGWYVWYAVRRKEKSRPPMLVGAGGYFGLPNEKGEVEIGFSIAPSCRGYGYATEMAKALVSNAFSDIRVQRVIAHTSPGNVASVKVLTKSGFRWVCNDYEQGNDLFEIVKSR